MATINGGARANLLRGTAGDDVIGADTGSDTVKAGDGADTVSGGGGGDDIRGGAGDDVLYGYGTADRAADSGAINVVQVANGLESPLFAASAPGDPDRLFVVEKNTGQIEIVDLLSGETNPTPFLDIAADDMTNSGERGLLGMAFAPDYETSGKIYVDVTNADGDIEIREYTRSAGDPDRADPDSMRVLLTIEHSAEDNHNGGWLGFGPDGYLYITVGDGGGRGDQDNSAQNLGELTGKVLRIDPSSDGFPGDPSRNYAIPDDNPFVDTDGARGEIWAYGLRNPFRMSFDSETGDAWIGDVGQNAWEEIDFIAAGSGGGQNFGWKVKEGDHPYDVDDPGNPDPNDPSLVDPFLEYPHEAGPYGGNVVTGGYVYHGPGGGEGLYFFADFGSDDNLWTVREVDGKPVDFVNHNNQLLGDAAKQFRNIASFAVDGQGRLYGVSINGTVMRLDTTAAVGDGADRLDGGDGADRIFGGAGADKLFGGNGEDQISGGLDADLIVGGAGADVLSGDRGADVFRYLALEDSATGAEDRITDLKNADVIDLSRIDAKVGKGGDQAFNLVDAFTGKAAQLVVQYDAGAGKTLVMGDVDGDGDADLTIILDGNQAGFSHFVL